MNTPRVQQKLEEIINMNSTSQASLFRAGFSLKSWIINAVISSFEKKYRNLLTSEFSNNEDKVEYRLNP